MHYFFCCTFLAHLHKQPYYLQFFHHFFSTMLQCFSVGWVPCSLNRTCVWYADMTILDMELPLVRYDFFLPFFTCSLIKRSSDMISKIKEQSWFTVHFYPTILLSDNEFWDIVFSLRKSCLLEFSSRKISLQNGHIISL